jgi:hypothetical protein
MQKTNVTLPKTQIFQIHTKNALPGLDKYKVRYSRFLIADIYVNFRHPLNFMCVDMSKGLVPALVAP